MDTFIFIITWEYSDNSGSGVVPRYYEDRALAEKDLELLKEHASYRTYKIHQLEFYG